MNREVKFCVNSKKKIFFFFWGGGGAGVRVDVNRDVKGGCERRIEVFVKKQKKKNFFFWGGGGGGGGVRVDVLKEFKFL